MAEPDKNADYEAYFDRWESVLHYPNPNLPVDQRGKIYGYSGDAGMIPCYKHKTCGAMVKLGAFNLGKYPPILCPGCGNDTRKEALWPVSA